MTDHDTVKNYLVDLVARLRENADEANSRGSEDLFQSGRALAYAEVLAIMQRQAEAFLIPLNELKLDGFDPIANLGSTATSATVDGDR